MDEKSGDTGDDQGSGWLQVKKVVFFFKKLMFFVCLLMIEFEFDYFDSN